MYSYKISTPLLSTYVTVSTFRCQVCPSPNGYTYLKWKLHHPRESISLGIAPSPEVSEDILAEDPHPCDSMPLVRAKQQLLPP